MFSRKELLASFSLANLCFFKQWNDLLDAKYLEPFYESLAAYPGSFLGLTLNICLVATGIYLLLQFAKRFLPAPSAYMILTPFLFFLVNGARLSVNDYRISFGFIVEKLGQSGAGFVLLLLLFSGIVLTIRRPKVFGRAIEAFLILLSPFLLITFLKGASIFPLRVGKAPQTVPAELSATGRQRFVWLLFDGFDYRMSFPERPSGLHLPAIDRLKESAHFATNAIQPGEDTSKSIPGYFLGRPLASHLVPTPQNTLEYTLKGDGVPVQWSPEQSFFDDLRGRGVHSAVAGWYIPYCELFRTTVDVCVRYPHYGINRQPYSQNPLASSLSFFYELVSFGSSAEDRHIRNYTALLKHAQEFATDDRIDFSYIHFPVPHHPIIYGKKMGNAYPTAESNLEGYFQNLHLVDQALEVFRYTLEKAGRWDDTTLLVTSDHASRAVFLHDNRFEDRIPYLLKLPNQKTQTLVSTRFNGVVTRELVLSHFDEPLTKQTVAKILQAASEQDFSTQTSE